MLRDVIASGIAPVTRLETIFRQAQGSQIITNAHRINQGKMPDFEAGTFVLDVKRDPSRRGKGKKRKGWKEDARKQRRRR